MDKRTIAFNEDLHKYTDEYNKVYTSVTQLIGKYEPIYDDEFWAIYRSIDQMAIYKPRPFLEERCIEIKYNGTRQKFSLDTLTDLLTVYKTHNEVKQEWTQIKEEACDWGNGKHKYLEDCIDRFCKSKHISFNDIVDTGRTAEQTFAFKITSVEELENSPLQFTYPSIYNILKNYILSGCTIFAEKRIYNAHYQIAGTIDVLIVKGNKFIILDWKTNRKKLKFESGYYKKIWTPDRLKKIETDEWVSTNQCFNPPLSHLPYCKGNTYNLQLSLYSTLCELWGMTCSGIILCHLRPQCNDKGEIVYDCDGNRIELEPEIYNMNFNKKDCITLLNHQLNNN